MTPYLGEIRMFAGDYAPQGWALCDGSVLQIAQYDALYVLLGTTFGGDGNQTFGLPDMRGRVPVHTGAGTGLTPIGLGQRGGAEKITLSQANLPPHTHVLNATKTPGTVPNPAGMLMATTTSEPEYVTNVLPTPQTDPPSPLPPPIAMHPSSITGAGQNLPVSLMQPYTAVNFIIATDGVYPPSN